MSLIPRLFYLEFSYPTLAGGSLVDDMLVMSKDLDEAWNRGDVLNDLKYTGFYTVCCKGSRDVIRKMPYD